MQHSYLVAASSGPLYASAKVGIKSEQVVDSSLYLVYNCAALVFPEIRELGLGLSGRPGLWTAQAFCLRRKRGEAVLEAHQGFVMSGRRPRRHS